MELLEIKKQLTLILNENFSQDIDLNIENFKLLEDGIGLNSLKIIEFIMYIEDKFMILIPDDELEPEKFYDIVSLSRFIKEIIERE